MGFRFQGRCYDSWTDMHAALAAMYPVPSGASLVYFRSISTYGPGGGGWTLTYKTRLSTGTTDADHTISGEMCTASFVVDRLYQVAFVGLCVVLWARGFRTGRAR